MKNIYISKLVTDLASLDFFICINDDEWQHRFDNTNYVHAGELNSEMLAGISSKNFIKISKKIDLEKWESVPDFLEKSYRELLEVIKINFLTGEKVL